MKLGSQGVSYLVFLKLAFGDEYLEIQAFSATS